MSIVEELKRRNVFKVAVAYLVVGWVVLQVAEFISPLLRLPEWTVSFALYIGIIGFPFALIFAWAFELTPEGLRRTQDVDPSQSITQETGAGLNKVIISLMTVVIVLLLADRFMPRDSGPADATASTDASATDNTSTIAATTPAEETSKPRSIAVLPFVNMSDDPQQEYFSDGISEELLNGLAKINELRVAARTSSFAFKGKNQDIGNIGQQLKVETVLEGSVRKSGQRIRVTAQLINVQDGYHLWSETYDRDLTDIFVIQDEISGAIVEALKVHLTDQEITAKTNQIDLDAYNFYLLARHNLRRRTGSSLELAISQYRKALDIDPSYAEAWAGMATATALLSESDYGEVPEHIAYRESQAMLDRAFALNPNLGQAHATQALLYMDKSRHADGLASIDRAIELAPTEGILRSWKYNALIALGRSKEAVQSMEDGYRIDPLHPTIRINLARNLAVLGQNRRAREMLTPNTTNWYELEAAVAQVNGQTADYIIEISKAIKLAEVGQDRRIVRDRSLSYFYELKNIPLAMEGIQPRLARYYQSELEPERFLDDFVPPEHNLDRIDLTAYIRASYQVNRCEQVIETLADLQIEDTPMRGIVGGPISHVELAIRYASCLSKMGETTRSQELAQRIESYLEAADDVFKSRFYQLARVQLLLGREAEALGSLRLDHQHYRLDWRELEDSELASLSAHPELIEIRKDLEKRMNRERAKLGWEPIEL